MDRDPASPAPALMECRPGWFGLTALVLNPTFTDVDDLDKLAQGTEGVEWTHWADMVNVYGTGPDGFARRPWDNVGVQYGLQALVDGTSRRPSSWTSTPRSEAGSRRPTWSRRASRSRAAVAPENFDPWSSRNMQLSPDGGVTPAARSEGDRSAIRAVQRTGMQFLGDVDIPLIDWRHYLEDELDMHNSQQSFAARQRMLNHDGDASNQVIWFTDARPAVAFDQTAMAFEVIDEWMANIRANPERSVADNKPAAAVDSCFDTNGTLIAAGEDVWDGVLDDEARGACTARFPTYSSSRRVAGAPVRGRRLEVPDAVDQQRHRRWALRGLAADARRAPPAPADLPRRRLRLHPPRRRQLTASHPSVCAHPSAGGRKSRTPALGWPPTLGWGLPVGSESGWGRGV